jgi:hypothetical protein
MLQISYKSARNKTRRFYNELSQTIYFVLRFAMRHELDNGIFELIREYIAYNEQNISRFPKQAEKRKDSSSSCPFASVPGAGVEPARLLLATGF